MKVALTQDELLNAIERGALVVTANTRASRNLRDAYDKRQRTKRAVWQSASVVSWGGWLAQLWSDYVVASREPVPALLNSEQAAVLWEQAIVATERDLRNAHLRATGAEAQQAWSLIHQFDVPREERYFGVTEDTRAFWRWSAEYDRRCRRHGWIDNARMPELVAGAISAKHVRVASEILLVGFDRLTPQQLRVVNACTTAGSQWTAVDLVRPVQSARRTCASDFESEIGSAAAWARQSLNSGAESVAIVVQGLQDKYLQVERVLLEQLQPAGLVISTSDSRAAFDLSVGGTLADTPLISMALLLLRLAAGTITAEEMSRIIRSPFLHGAEEELHSRALFDAELRAQGRVDVGLDDAIRLAHRATADKKWYVPKLREQFEALKSATEKTGKYAPSRWSEKLPELLKAAGWPGDRVLNSAEFQAREAWLGLLSSLATLDVVERELSLAQVLERLTAIATDTQFKPENEGAAVQVLGMLEAAGSDFDHMWVLGVDDKAWPPAPHPSPFIPLALQRKHEIPASSCEIQWNFAQRVTQRLTTSAGQVVFSHARSDGETDLGPSALISHIAHAELEDIVENAGAGWVASIAASAAIEECRESDGVEFAADHVKGGTRVLQLQAACPFRAYAEFRLGAESLESPTPGLDPRERGKVLHAALQFFWTRTGSKKKLDALTPEQEKDRISECVSEALQKCRVGAGGDWERGIAELEHERVCRIVAQFISLERTRNDFTVLLKEEPKKIEIGGLKFDVKIDRVDELDDGARILLDYKTGGTSIASWMDERLDEPQLPIYATQMEKPPAAVAFVEVQTTQSRFKGIASRADALPGVDTEWKRRKSDEDSVTLDIAMGRWNQWLENLAKEFRSGRADVAPKNGDQTCRHCGLESLCRVTELQNESVEEADADADQD